MGLEASHTTGSIAKPEIAARMASFNNSRLHGLKQYQILFWGEVDGAKFGKRLGNAIAAQIHVRGFPAAEGALQDHSGATYRGTPAQPTHILESESLTLNPEPYFP